jgi:hypothetical protein
MLDDIRGDKIGAVVTWDLDRLHRQPIELERFMVLADEKSLALATVGGDADLSTDNGRLFARIKGAVARAEVERKGARQKRSNQQRAAAGRGWGSRAFGYTADDQLNLTEAAALRDAYSAILAGASLHSIAKGWNESGLYTAKAGKPWAGSTLRQMLLNPRNAGLRAYNGEIVGPAAWPAIVERDIYDGAVAVLKDPGRRSGKTRARKYLLSGIAVCGLCGHTLTSDTSGSKQQTRMVYTCKHCFRVSRSVDKVDDLVTRAVVKRLTQPDAVDLMTARDRVDIGALRDKANALRARLDSLARDFADGELNSSQLRIANERIKANLADVESQMFSANATRVFDGVVVPGDTPTAEDVRHRFEELTLDRKRALVDVLMTITVAPAGRCGRRFDPKLIGIVYTA